jgi:hypothetical protein
MASARSLAVRGRFASTANAAHARRGSAHVSGREYSEVSESLGSEIPRILAEQLGDGAKNAALNHHPLMQFVIAVQAGHSFDREPVEDDSSLSLDDPPTIEPAGSEGRGGQDRNLEPGLCQFVRPQVLEILGGRRDSHIEQVGARAQERQVRAGDGRSDAPTVTIAPSRPRGYRRTVTPRCGHVPMLDRRARARWGIPVRRVIAQ